MPYTKEVSEDLQFSNVDTHGAGRVALVVMFKTDCLQIEKVKHYCYSP